MFHIRRNNKRGKQEWWSPIPTERGDVEKVLKFLSVRPDSQGFPILDYFEAPIPHDDDWYEFKNKDFDEERLPKTTDGPHPWRTYGKPDWLVAFHQAKLEGLYATVGDWHDPEKGGLCGSSHKDQGHRCWLRAPGVYTHGPKSWHLSESYVRNAPVLR